MPPAGAESRVDAGRDERRGASDACAARIAHAPIGHRDVGCRDACAATSTWRAAPRTCIVGAPPDAAGLRLTPMIPLGLLHVAAAVVALASGAVVLLQRKGTARHRRIGWAYVASMTTLNVTALLIYRLFGGFGPFHVAALVSLATLAAGVVTVVRRRPADRWVEHHYWWMAYSYLGLVAAGVAETTTRSGVVGFWWAVLAATVLTFAVGSTMIRRRASATLAPFARSAPPP